MTGTSVPIAEQHALRSTGVLRKHAGAALALAVFVALFDALWNFGFWIGGLNGGLAWFGHNLITAPSFALSIFAAALVAEHATARGVHYAIAWSGAVAAGCLIATGVQWLILDKVFDWSVFASGELLMRGVDKATWTRQQQPVWALLTWSIPAILSALLYAHWRRAVQVRSRLYAAELARAETERRVLEAQLQATQARVEPQFLFDTLARVKAMHSSDPSKAVTQLDRLIAFLRAALPRLGDTRSTLAQELDLCRAYIDIDNATRSNACSFTIAAPDALAGASVPAMVLLPLVAHVARSTPLSGGHPIIALATDLYRNRLRVTLRARSVDENMRSAVPEDVRRRLDDLYGGRAVTRVDVDGDGGVRITVEIPLDVVADPAAPARM